MLLCHNKQDVNIKPFVGHDGLILALLCKKITKKYPDTLDFKSNVSGYLIFNDSLVIARNL